MQPSFIAVDFLRFLHAKIDCSEVLHLQPTFSKLQNFTTAHASMLLAAVVTTNVT